MKWYIFDENLGHLCIEPFVRVALHIRRTVMPMNKTVPEAHIIATLNGSNVSADATSRSPQNIKTIQFECEK